MVSGDVEELKAAVWNLIDNAIKYSPSEPRVRVLLEETATSSGWRCACSTTASGISPAELKRVFRRFYRVPTPSAVARAAAAASASSSSDRSRGGTAGRPSRESEGTGRGSTFTLLLPRASAGMTATGHRVLIVEDEHHLAEGLRFNLEAEGYEADVVEPARPRSSA